MFQSPQWGSNSKVSIIILYVVSILFQSPQWGSNSKDNETSYILIDNLGFSPRNGEVILKGMENC